jgi:hypothetical protein
MFSKASSLRCNSKFFASKSDCNKDGFSHECKECIKERGRKSKSRGQKENEFLKNWL